MNVTRVSVGTYCLFANDDPHHANFNYASIQVTPQIKTSNPPFPGTGAANTGYYYYYYYFHLIRPTKRHIKIHQALSIPLLILDKY